MLVRVAPYTAGTPELAYATYARSCGIEKPTGSGRIDSFLEPSTPGEARDRGRASLRASSSASDELIGGLPLDVFILERRFICADIWRVWVRHREGLCRSRGVTEGCTYPGSASGSAPSSSCIPPVVSRPSSSDSAATKAEHERSLSVLTAFMRFNPPMFDGKEADPWVLETWFTSMEALFEDIYTLEKDKVHLAAHCFEKYAQIWWQKTKKSRVLNPSLITWEEFREIVFMEYFPDSDRRKMKEDFRKLRQGNHSVREYEREFTHLVNCVPGMVHTDRDRADYFEWGLRPEIFKIISALKLKSFEEVLDRALWVERSNAIAREERESFDREREREKGKKRTAGGAGGQSSSKRPPRYPRPQQRYQGPPGYVICGGNHQAVACSQKGR
uniref:Retrotransposon gag domain-containing protein n=1 Tax=Ananas comosus var. bracteatus TaxID=296719 RepID=A0A6V7NXJ1_ANACO|nr:unnamed protein product [Ananas comosus var. bracteatus]